MTDIYIYADGCRVKATEIPDNARHVYASGCTALTELRADNATHVDASGCTALVELRADNATTVYASGCTALVEPDLPNVAALRERGIRTHAAGNSLFIGPIGSRDAWLVVRKTDGGIVVIAGCFSGTVDAFFNAVEATHGGNEHGQNYRLTEPMIQAWGAQ